MKWIEKFEKILKTIERFRNESSGDYVVFRGQSNFTWNLDTSLKVAETQRERPLYFEYDLYFDFVTNAKGYVNNQMQSWEIITEMRHFGLPVRVLDWTESLNAALYFAVKDSKINPDYAQRKNDAALYILDPFRLNELTLGEDRIYNPLDKTFVDFENIFFEEKIPETFKNRFMNPFSVIMPRRTERISAQKGLFTVQGTNDKSITEIKRLNSAYIKVKIERQFFADIDKYLYTSGVNHFTIYPDFEGLAMHLKEENDI